MVGNTRRTRSTTATAEPKAPARGRVKRRADADLEAIEAPVKKAREENEEPGPEPLGQPFVRLEKKIKELIAQNQQLKDEVERLKSNQDGEEKPRPEKKPTAKAQPKSKTMSKRVLPKRKAAKAKGKAVKA